jgi:hypothetical protein
MNMRKIEEVLIDPPGLAVIQTDNHEPWAQKIVA